MDNYKKSLKVGLTEERYKILKVNRKMFSDTLFKEGNSLEKGIGGFYKIKEENSPLSFNPVVSSIYFRPCINNICMALGINDDKMIKSLFLEDENFSGSKNFVEQELKEKEEILIPKLRNILDLADNFIKTYEECLKTIKNLQNF
ncbi:MAG: hypothetical protein WC849_02710 [Candidatus Paceibacterota bacterium]